MAIITDVAEIVLTDGTGAPYLIADSDFSQRKTCLLTVDETLKSYICTLVLHAQDWSGTLHLMDAAGLELGRFSVQNGVVTQDAVVTAHHFYHLQYAGTALQIAAVLDPVRFSFNGNTEQSGTSLSRLEVGSGGLLEVGPGGRVSEAVVVSGGTVQVTGGTVTQLNTASGACLEFVINSGTAISGVCEGRAFTAADGMLENFLLGSGGKISVQDGIFRNGSVGSSAVLQLSAGGTADNVIVLTGGSMFSDGGTVKGLRLENGASAELDGGSLQGSISVGGRLELNGQVDGSGISDLQLDLSSDAVIQGFSRLQGLHDVTVVLDPEMTAGRCLILDTSWSSLPADFVLYVRSGEQKFELTPDSGITALENGSICRLKSQPDGVQLVLLDDHEAPEITVAGTFDRPQQAITLRVSCPNEEEAEIYFSTSGEEGSWLLYDNDNGVEITANGRCFFRAEDEAGNVSSKTIDVANIDRTAPAFSGDGGNSAIVDRHTVFLTWSEASDDSGIDHYVVVINGEEFTVKDHELTTELSANGTYAPQVYAVDAAGNCSPVLLLPEITINVHDELVITGTTAVTVGDGAATCTWRTVSPGSGILFDLRLDQEPVITTTDSRYTFTGLDLGSHTIMIRARSDDAEGEWYQTDFSVKDVTPPVIRNLSATQKDGSYDVILRFSAEDNAAVTTCLVSGVLPGRQNAVVMSPAITGPEEEFTFSVPENCIGMLSGTLTVGDVEGNTASQFFTVSITDVSSPVWSEQSFLSGKVSEASGGTVTWNGATDNVGVTKYTARILNASGNSVQSATVTSNQLKVAKLAAGGYMLELAAHDATGNSSALKNFSFSVSDTKSPVLKSVSGSQKKGTYLVNLKVKASDNVGVTGYALTYVNPKTKKKVSLNLTGTTFTVAENCVGTLKCTLKAVDAAGNKSSAKSFTVKIKDYTAPAWKSSAKSSVSAVTRQKGGTLKWSGATDNVKVTKYTVKVLNSSGKTVKSYSTASSSVKLSGIKAGVNFSYKITAKDAAGNTGKTALTGQFGVGDVSNNTYKTASKLKKNKSIAAVLNSADKLDFYSFSGASSLDLEIDTGSVKATLLNAKGKKVGSVITLQQGSTYNWDLASYGTARYLKLESKNAQYLLASKA